MYCSSFTPNLVSTNFFFLPEQGTKQVTAESKQNDKEVDVRKLIMNQRQQIIAKIFKVVEEDNEKCL